MDGNDFLSRFIQDRLENNERTSGLRRLTPFDLLEIKGLSHGLVAASALSQAEAEHALEAHLQPSSVAGSRHLRPSHQNPGTVRAMPHDPTRTADAATPQEHNVAAIPLRVMPLLGVASHLAPHVVFLSLEVWSSMIAVRMAYPAGVIPPVQRLRQQTNWQAIDNTGREYMEAGRVSSDMAGIVFSTRFFTPGPLPPSAALTVTITDLQLSQEEATDLPLR